jgi:hypothetical protein
MSFWALSDGGSAVTNEKEYDAGGGSFEVIPKGTSVLAAVGDASWKAVYQRDEEFVNVKWQILKPEAYAGRVLFQKLFVGDDDPNTPPDKMPAKRDKHKRMLMAIDANSKGRLAKITSRPSDDDLALALMNSQAVLTLGVWDKDVDGKKEPGGNWVSSIKPKSAAISEVAKAPVKKDPASNFATDDDDDIPF